MTIHDFDWRDSDPHPAAQAGSGGTGDISTPGDARPPREDRSLASVSRELDAGSAAVAAAAQALKEAATVLREIRAKLLAAAMPQANRGGIQTDVTALLDQLRDIAFASAVNGTNLLVHPRGGSPHVPIVAALARGTSGEITVSAIDIDRSVTALFGEDVDTDGARRGILDKAPGNIASSLRGLAISGLSDTPRDQALLDRHVMQVDEAIISVKSAQSHLSIARSRINLQASFINSLTDAAEAEPATPPESDLDLDSARRTAIETGRLLRGQPQSIASLNSQTVLKLFRRP